MLWPMLELSLQRDISESVLRNDIEVRHLLGRHGVMSRKVEGTVPHDLGSPSEEPWTKVNAYVFQVNHISDSIVVADVHHCSSYCSSSHTL